MLSVPEEFLLLTLKDEGGAFVDLPVESRRAGFVGAILMELALQDRLDYDNTQVWLVDETPTGSRALDPVLTRLSNPLFSKQSEHLIGRLVDLGDSVREACLNGLCEKGILVETEGRFRWLLKTRRYPITDGREIREVKLRLREVLLHDGLPDPRDVCLMSLLETCGLTGQIVENSDLALAQSRIAMFSKMELVGQDSRRYLDILSRSMVLAIHSDV
jgi:Golgi phosphoprotein 3